MQKILTFNIFLMKIDEVANDYETEVVNEQTRLLQSKVTKLMVT